jgi:hypothetical protein
MAPEFLSTPIRCREVIQWCAQGKGGEVSHHSQSAMRRLRQIARAGKIVQCFPLPVSLRVCLLLLIECSSPPIQLPLGTSMGKRRMLSWGSYSNVTHNNATITFLTCQVQRCSVHSQSLISQCYSLTYLYPIPHITITKTCITPL